MPAAVKNAAGTVATNSVAVGCDFGVILCPFHRSTEEASKPTPVTVTSVSTELAAINKGTRKEIWGSDVVVLAISGPTTTNCEGGVAALLTLIVALGTQSRRVGDAPLAKQAGG